MLSSEYEYNVSKLLAEKLKSLQAIAKHQINLLVRKRFCENGN